MGLVSLAMQAQSTAIHLQHHSRSTVGPTPGQTTGQTTGSAPNNRAQPNHPAAFSSEALGWQHDLSDEETEMLILLDRLFGAQVRKTRACATLRPPTSQPRGTRLGAAAAGQKLGQPVILVEANDDAPNSR